MQTPPLFKVNISSLPLFYFSPFPLPLSHTSSVILKRCKSIWNLVIKHIHTNKFRWVFLEFLLSYFFFFFFK